MTALSCGTPDGFRLSFGVARILNYKKTRECDVKMELERTVRAKRSRGDCYENIDEVDSVQIKFKRLLGKPTTYLCLRTTQLILAKLKTKNVYSRS